jgi:hypothetical protein
MQRPMVLAFVLCEQFIVEEKTRNLTLVNCFTRRTVELVPSEPLSFMALAQLSDGQGTMPMGVTIRHWDTDDEVAEEMVQVHFPDQLHEARFSLRVTCSFPVLGASQVSLVAGGEVIAQRKLRIQAKEIEP